MPFQLRCMLCDKQTGITCSNPVNDWICWKCRDEHGFGIARTAEEKHRRWKQLADEREKRNRAS